jgi:hypothetical protein
MPYTSELIDDGRGMHHVGRGVLSGAEILAGAIADHEPPGRAARLTHGFVDLTDVTQLQLSPDDIRHIVSENRVTASQAKKIIVVVVAPLDHPFGMARMWEALAHETGWTTRVFRARAEALEWLTAELGRDPGVPRSPEKSRG